MWGERNGLEVKGKANDVKKGNVNSQHQHIGEAKRLGIYASTRGKYQRGSKVRLG